MISSELVRIFVVSLITILILDAVVLGYLLKNWWRIAILDIQHADLEIRWPYAIMTYILLSIVPVATWYFFKTHSIDIDKNFVTTLAFSGFIIYGVYDTTNIALLKQYPVYLGMIDIAWGTILMTIVGFVVKYIFN